MPRLQGATQLPKPVKTQGRSGRCPNNTSRNRQRSLRLEPLEQRHLLALLISEIQADPLFGDNSQDQYIEFRGTPGETIPNGTYFVVVDGWSPKVGNITSVFDLSGQKVGNNGYLVLLEQGNGYATDSQATVLTSTAPGFGGLPNGMFRDLPTTSDHMSDGSNSFLLIQSATPPIPGADIDTNNDGTPDHIFNSWTVIDSVAVLNIFDSDKAFANIVFRWDGTGSGLPSSTLVDTDHEITYVARIGESTGYAPTDWLGANTTERTSNSFQYRIERGVFGNPEPNVYAGRDLDHIGRANFFGSVSGTVFHDQNGNGVQNDAEPGLDSVVVFADQNGDSQISEFTVRVEPDDFPERTDLTNLIPNATLTTADFNNEMLSFKVRNVSNGFPQWTSTGTLVFAGEGVPFFPNHTRLRVDFYKPVRSVSIDAIGITPLADVYGRLEAFNAAGQSMGFVRTGPLRENQIERLTISHSTADIAWVVAYSDENFLNSSPFGRFDNLSFIQPEYSTTTNAQGDYKLNLLPADEYSIVQITPPGFEQGTPDSPSTHEITISSTEDLHDVDFGDLQNVAPSISDQSFTIDENAANGTIVGTVVATDANKGQTIRFGITGGNGESAFAINATTGQITVKNASAINFEATPSLTLIVSATDNAVPPASSSATMTIQIHDGNDPPTIPDQSFTIEENAANGTLVGKVNSHDDDGGSDGEVTYAIVGGNAGNAFFIESASGQLTVANSLAVNFEERSSFELMVQATDKGTPAKSSTKAILISVTNLNEPPVITTQSLEIAENSIRGAVVGVIEVHDPDVADIFTFQVLGGTGQQLFAVNGTTGQVTLNETGVLDFETQKTYSLEVEVRDHGTPTAIRSRSIQIHVGNVNEKPVLLPQSFSISEDSPPGSIVGQIAASDSDLGQALVFTVVGGNGPNKFAVNRNTGAITVAEGATIDFEEHVEWTLVVEVTDNGAPIAKASATMTIRPNNVNDAPAIESQSFVLDENAVPGTVVGTVVAHDADAGDSFTFQIVGGSGASLFAISPHTGQLTVAESAVVDRETNEAYRVEVKVTDAAGLHDAAAVTIELRDQNEFTPVIVTNQLHVAENAAVGAEVGKVLATDQDATATLAFAILAGNVNDAFKIDATSGVITVQTSSALNFETGQSFELTIEVADGGQPVRKATANVKVHLRDVNEFSPAVEPHTFFINENIAVNTTIGTVFATDQDTNQKLHFAIVEGNADGFFRIDAETGAIATAESTHVDFEAKQSYQLQVRVSDNGDPPRSTNVPVTVRVNDLNEFAPTVHNGVFTIPENLANGSRVGIVEARDEDSKQLRTYAITDGDPHQSFAIDATTGEITVWQASTLDFEAQRDFVLTVSVTDNVQPVRTGTGTVTIRLRDVNESSPEIDNATFDVPENAAVGTVVGRIAAHDTDANQTLAYTITAGNEGGVFSIDERSGEIKIQNAATLNFETRIGYDLTVQVSDNGDPKRTSSITVPIQVRDANEFAPKLERTTFHINENTNSHAIADLSVEDNDHAQTHTFVFAEGTANALFELNAATGVLTLKNGARLDHEATAEINVAVRITDNGSPPRETTETVHIVVDNVNEQPVANAGGPYEIDAGETLVLDASDSIDVDANDLLTFKWDVNQDGRSDLTTTNRVDTISWTKLLQEGLHPGTYQVRLEVTDANGAHSQAVATLHITETFMFEAPEGVANTELTLSLNGNDLAVRAGSQVLNTVIHDEIDHVVISGSNADETLTVDYTGGNPIPLGGLEFDGGAGRDTYVIGGSGIHIDLTGPSIHRFRNIEALNIIGHSPNTLTLDAPSVVEVTDGSNTLTVVSDLDDTVNLEGTWRMTGTTVEDGRFIRIIQQAGATVHLAGPADWNNPITPFDVNANGSVEPLDVLVIVNELNDPDFSDPDHRLVLAAGLTKFPNFFYDVRADGFIVPLDALAIINFLNSRANGEGESSDGAVADFATPSASFSTPLFLVADEANATGPELVATIDIGVDAPAVQSAIGFQMSADFADFDSSLGFSPPRSQGKDLVDAVDQIFAELKNAAEL